MEQFKFIKIDGYWIVVSDDKIKNCLVFYPKENKIGHISGFIDLTSVKGEWAYKVIASQNPEHNIPTIKFYDEAAKELGIVDVEKLAMSLTNSEEEKHIKKQNSKNFIEYTLPIHCKNIKDTETLEKRIYLNRSSDFTRGVIKCYNQCLSDNVEKKFTLEDVRKAYEAGIHFNEESSEHFRLSDDNKWRWENFIQALTKQEYEVELEMEEKCCGLLGNTTKDSDLSIDCNICSCRNNFKPKITDNSVTVLKILK